MKKYDTHNKISSAPELRMLRGLVREAMIGESRPFIQEAYREVLDALYEGIGAKEAADGLARDLGLKL